MFLPLEPGCAPGAAPRKRELFLSEQLADDLGGGVDRDRVAKFVLNPALDCSRCVFEFKTPKLTVDDAVDLGTVVGNGFEGATQFVRAEVGHFDCLGLEDHRHAHRSM